MAIGTNSYKGTRDFYPEDKRTQKWMFSTISESVEKFGYEQYDAPVLESTDLYTIKGSSEIINEQSYTFEDRGGRSVTLRTEMTPSVSRMVANKRQHLEYPLRWYSIPNLWRYERPQRGRLREFWQLNVDIFGDDSTESEIEVIQIADSILKSFGAKKSMYNIKINSRKLVDYIFKDYLKLDSVQSDTVKKLIDKRSKMDSAEFYPSIEAVISPSHRDSSTLDKLTKILEINAINELPMEISQLDCAQRLIHIIETLHTMGITNVLFDPSLMRGFDYYTDIVFEVFDSSPNNNRSMYGGGRYDGLVEAFGVQKVPTVGFGMGDVTLENFLRDNNLIPELSTETELYIALTPGLEFIEVNKKISLLREESIKVAVDYTNRKLGKQIETAVKKGIPYCIVVGAKELKDNFYTLKNIRENTESSHSLERIISIIKA